MAVNPSSDRVALADGRTGVVLDSGGLPPGYVIVQIEGETNEQVIYYKKALKPA